MDLGPFEALFKARHKRQMTLGERSRRKGKVVLRKLLKDRICEIAGERVSNAVEIYVRRLHKRLTDGGAHVKIETVRGVG
jgi:DNA-binding response OmpR family regulator